METHEKERKKLVHTILLDYKSYAIIEQPIARAISLCVTIQENTISKGRGKMQTLLLYKSTCIPQFSLIH